MNLGWSYDERAHRPVPPHRPGGLGVRGPRPGAHAGHRVAGAPRHARRRRRLHLPGRRRARPSCAAPSTRPAGSRPPSRRSTPPAADRSATSPPSSASPPPCPSTPAASACWPATTSRRPTTSACRSSASGSSTATATSASTSTAGAGSRSASPASTPGPWPSTRSSDVARQRRARRRAGARPRCGRPRSAASRSTCSTPTSTRTTTSNRLVCDRLYGGGARGAHPPGDRARHRRRARPQGARPAARGVPHERGPRRLPRPRAHPPGRCSTTACRSPRPEAAVRPGAVFTTHTPVPAGIDRFPRELMEKYFSNWCRDVRRSPSTTSWPSATSRARPSGEGSTWPPWPAPGRPEQRRVRAARRGEPRDVRRPLARRCPSTRCRSRRSPTACTPAPGPRRRWPRCYDRVIGDDWPEAPAEAWKRASRRCPTASCGPPAGTAASGWCRTPARRLRQTALERGASESQVAWTDEVLDPDVLTIGFARRFATYKRATLLFRDLDRLKALLLDEERPVQLIFAGKAHPADDPGKELLRQVAQLAADLDLRHRLVLLEDYDITVARMLVQRRRRVAQHPAAPARGVRHLRHEGRVQRRAQLLDPRRLVGRDVRPRRRLGHPVGRVAGRHRGPQRPRGAPACSACSSARSCRSSTSATTTACPATGWPR